MIPVCAYYTQIRDLFSPENTGIIPVSYLKSIMRAFLSMQYFALLEAFKKGKYAVLGPKTNKRYYNPLCLGLAGSKLPF